MTAMATALWRCGKRDVPERPGYLGCQAVALTLSLEPAGIVRGRFMHCPQVPERGVSPFTTKEDHAFLALDQALAWAETVRLAVLADGWAEIPQDEDVAHAKIRSGA